ncbi:radical SAM protein [archaeon SCG-AAA382B04]|nr:radical SAM protein [archaeon SCG-AAA382B04]
MDEITVLKKPGLEVFLEVDEDEIKFKSEGILSSISQPILKKLNVLLEDEKPISFTRDELIISTWLPPVPSEPFSRALRNEIKARLLNKHSPQAVSLNISECTLECDECNILEGKRLETDLVKNFIEGVQDLGAFSIGFAEGEPLLRDDIFDLIEHVDKQKSVVSVFTPGTKLDREVASELKKRDVYSIVTGIKSPIPEEHDEARGVEGAFEMAISGMEAALENDLLVSMHTHAKPRLVRSGKLEKIYELAKEVGVDELSIWESHPTWNYIYDTEIMPTEQDRRRIANLYEKANNSEDGPRIFYNQKFESKNLFGCMAGNRWLNLIHSGDVTPCTYVPISFGNIKRSSIEDIWKRMSNHDDFAPKKSCVMLDTDFREKYFKDIEPSNLPVKMYEDE